jgi:hypothetical protein
MRDRRSARRVASTCAFVFAFALVAWVEHVSCSSAAARLHATRLPAVRLHAARLQACSTANRLREGLAGAQSLGEAGGSGASMAFRPRSGRYLPMRLRVSCMPGSAPSATVSGGGVASGLPVAPDPIPSHPSGLTVRLDSPNHQLISVLACGSPCGWIIIPRPRISSTLDWLSSPCALPNSTQLCMLPGRLVCSFEAAAPKLGV